MGASGGLHVRRASNSTVSARGLQLEARLRLLKVDLGAGSFSPQIQFVHVLSTGSGQPSGDIRDFWLNSRVVLHRDSLLTRAQIGPVGRRELPALGYIRIRRGVYLPEAQLPSDAPRWEIRRAISQARALSVSVARRGTAVPVLSLESALALHGLDTWTNTVDISYRIESNTGRRRLLNLEPIRAAGVDICAVTERQLMSTPPRSNTLRVSGVLTAALGVVALDCARYLHPLAATVAVSSVLRHASGFDPRNLARCRAMESKARDLIRRDLTAISGRRDCRQAAAVVNIADAGIQTPGEGYMWWLLHCMLPEKCLRDLVTQWPIVLEGRRYFPDAALPKKKVLFEFDGFGKIPENEREFLTRQRAFLSAGWTPIRVDQGQLDHPSALIDYLMRELHGCGVAAHYPSGTLWKPLTRALLAPERRF